MDVKQEITGRIAALTSQIQFESECETSARQSLVNCREKIEDMRRLRAEWQAILKTL